MVNFVRDLPWPRATMLLLVLEIVLRLLGGLYWQGRLNLEITDCADHPAQFAFASRAPKRVFPDPLGPIITRG